MEAGKLHTSTCPASHCQKQVLTLPGRSPVVRNGERPRRQTRACRSLEIRRPAKVVRCIAAAAVAVETPTRTKTAGHPLKVMIAGAPAAGKGTQCQKIVDKFGLVHISAGDLLRAEVASGSEAGRKAESFMKQGNLVPNELVVEMVKNRLSQEDAQKSGWLLDGYPRSAEQAEAIQEAGIKPDVFILIDVSDDELVERVTGRRLDPETNTIYHMKFKPPPEDVVDRLIQRSDDTEDSLRNRLATHHKNVEAVVGYYKDMLVEVNGQRSMDEVFAEIDGVLSAFTEDESPAHQR
ncbi:probable adenylate kinase 2, chloroplastic [Coccomyxa sp. Obi]|nr:probable adenylate kinase 2, chloroplastic [Coccomyxa sp. Obi]